MDPLSRRKMMLAAILVIAALTAGSPASGCSVCSCGDPLLAANDPDAVGGRLRLGVDTEYLSVKSGAPWDKLGQSTLRVKGACNPLPSLSLVAQVPFTRKNLNNADGSGSDLSGIGDAELGARMILWDLTDSRTSHRQNFSVSLGTSLPIGSRTGTFHGHDVDEHGQLGTGSWGPYAGVQYRLDRKQWTALANATGRLRSTNADDYQYGNSLLWSAHGQRALSSRVVLDLGVDARHAVADKQAGETIEDTGGTLLTASPGVHWSAAGPVWFTLRAQLPIYSHLLGTQSIGPTIDAGFQYLVF
jgi:hypothetical protein